MICRFCGYEGPEDSTFCVNCGSQLELRQPVQRASGLKMSENLNTNRIGSDMPLDEFDVVQSRSFQNGAELLQRRENLRPVRQVQLQPKELAPQEKKNNKGLLIATVVVSVFAIAAVFALIFYFVGNGGSCQTDKKEQTSIVASTAQPTTKPVATTPAAQQEAALSISDVSELVESWAFYYMDGDLATMSMFYLSEDGSVRMYNVALGYDGGYDYGGTWKPISKEGQCYVVEFSVIGGAAIGLTEDGMSIMYEQNKYTFWATLQKNGDSLYIQQSECNLPPLLVQKVYDIYIPGSEAEYLENHPAK